MSLPESFTTCLGDPQITPETGRLADVPKALLKHLRPLGHELTLWQAAAQRWRTRLEKARFEPTLLTFLQHWQPKVTPDEVTPDVFNVILRGNDESGWKVIASSLKWVNDPAWSALLNLPALSHYWITDIRGSHLDHLRQIVSRAWFMDPSPLPPGSVIAGLDIPGWPNLLRLKGRGRQWVIHGTETRLEDAVSDGQWQNAIAAAVATGSTLLVEQPQGPTTLLARYKKGEDGIQLDGVWQAE
ncbi:hypothetical protein [Brevifollis gellanilyticus]|uniref:Uncharacterized protein n=1 Tax=Brevifollis gellanilyticus TaxID=748831 RepID=A0A512MFQ3_9BACT|nr:hypothetical protein [Brevifollis gellanilyticus]GEP45570.1 hypothetical protein BGE01nite_48610 [Brevifollis gellanilyticus]